MLKVTVVAVAFVAALASAVYFTLAAGDGIGCVSGQAQDGPPPGAPTPNATQLAYWPTLEHELGLDEKFGAQTSVGEPDVSGLTWQDWADPQPAEPGPGGEPTPPSGQVGGVTDLATDIC